MDQTYKTEGIILHRWDYKEQDRMVRFLTRDHGKLTARAISARKAGAKLAGHLEPFMHTELFFARSRSTIDIVAGSNAINAHVGIRRSMPHAAMASYYAEIVDRFTHDRDTDEALYEHVQQFYQWLNENSQNALVLYASVIQMLPLLGYHIELHTCHTCKLPVRAVENKFVYGLWNVECDTCTSDNQKISLPVSALKVIRFLQSNPYADIAKLRLQSNDWATVDQLVRSLLRYHSEKELRSEKVFIAVLNQNAPK